MNRVEIVGRITKDVELKTTPSGKSVVSFSVAVDRRSKDDGADFVSCVAWGKTADNMSRYLHKGDRIGVCGHLNTRTYEDKRNEKRFVMEVVADEVEFLSERKKANEEQPILDFLDDDLPF